MEYSMKEIVSLIKTEVENKKIIFDAREHLLNIYKYHGEIIDAFKKGDEISLKDSIGNLFLSLILISERYDVDVNSLEWDDEGVDTDKGYSAFYKEVILLSSVIGSMSSEIYSIQYANINSDISSDVEGVLEKLSNVACVSSILLQEVCYAAYENWKAKQ